MSNTKQPYGAYISLCVCMNLRCACLYFVVVIVIVVAAVKSFSHLRKKNSINLCKHGKLPTVDRKIETEKERQR